MARSDNNSATSVKTIPLHGPLLRGDRRPRVALLSHFGADVLINTALIPITSGWLGLPVVLGVPILFDVLRKQLSLLMIHQALGTLEIMPLLDHVQIFTFLVFLTFYVPCLSTFAVML